MTKPRFARALIAATLGAALTGCGAPSAGSEIAGSASVQTTTPARAASAPADTGYVGENLASQAHVTIAQARAAAQAVRLGAVTDQELEREPGGTGLRYSFDINDGGVTYEVGVDAQTGAILENAAEGAHPD